MQRSTACQPCKPCKPLSNLPVPLSPGSRTLDPSSSSILPHCSAQLNRGGTASFPRRHARGRGKRLGSHGFPSSGQSSAVAGKQEDKCAPAGSVLHFRLHQRGRGGSDSAQGSLSYTRDTPKTRSASNQPPLPRLKQRPKQDGGNLRIAGCRPGRRTLSKIPSSTPDRFPTGLKSPWPSAFYQSPSRTVVKPTSLPAALMAGRTTFSSTNTRQTRASCRTRTAAPTTPWSAR